MSIKVRYFASLKELVGHDNDDCAFVSGMTVLDAWHKVMPEKTMPANILAAINMEYVSLESVLMDADELAFFPPVTGG
ncbi:MAG: molybdopterin synthase sulfur carrier subunit [Methyloprofundus sp.]|nr:molybdopterin synthase sulfur carrier subunit [Methyloprofundus sp.]